MVIECGYCNIIDIQNFGCLLVEMRMKDLYLLVKMRLL